MTSVLLLWGSQSSSHQIIRVTEEQRFPSGEEVVEELTRGCVGSIATMMEGGEEQEEGDMICLVVAHLGHLNLPVMMEVEAHPSLQALLDLLDLLDLQVMVEVDHLDLLDLLDLQVMVEVDRLGLLDLLDPRVLVEGEVVEVEEVVVVEVEDHLGPLICLMNTVGVLLR